MGAAQIDLSGHKQALLMRRLIKYGGALIVVIALVLLAWGLIEPYTLERTTYHAQIPELPAQWQDRRVAVFGDMQVGMWLDNELTMRRAVQAVIEERPAMALIVGDFVYHAADVSGSQIERAAALLKPLTEARIPTFAVLGNHDYGLAKRGGDANEDLAKALREALEANGITILVNESVPVHLAPGDQPLYVVGVGSYYARRDNPEEALAGVPPSAPRIVMMHNPQSYSKLEAHAAPLAVAGHTHGGQVRLPFLPAWSYITFVREEDVHADGWIESDYGAVGNRLYVNRGLGMSVLPIRINAPPELTFFDLKEGEIEQ